jgi:hypothetical protein
MPATTVTWEFSGVNQQLSNVIAWGISKKELYSKNQEFVDRYKGPKNALLLPPHIL